MIKYKNIIKNLNFLRNKNWLLENTVKLKLSTRYLIQQLEKRQIFYICDEKGEQISIQKPSWEFHIVRWTDFWLNSNNIEKIFTNKALTGFLLSQHWIKCPQEIILNREEKNWEQIKSFTQQNWFPLVMKPIDQKRWVWVYIIKTLKELKKYFLDFWDDRNYQNAIFQNFVKWKEYRVLYLDWEILIVYEKVPFYIIWNWVESIKVLIEKNLKNKIKMISLAKKIIFHRWDDENKILNKWEKYQVFEVINDASAETIKKKSYSEDEIFLNNIAKCFWARYFWADIITTWKISQWSVIEINSRPAILWAMKDYPNFKNIFWEKIVDSILK